MYLGGWLECRRGRHAWQQQGGRPCAKGMTHCSQPVYHCARPGCRAYDYGEPGGPGAEACADCALIVEE